MVDLQPRRWPPSIVALLFILINCADPSAPEQISINSAVGDTLVVGDTTQLEAVVMRSGVVVDSARIVWSTDPARATVDSTGRVVAKAAGVVTVTARSGRARGAASFHARLAGLGTCGGARTVHRGALQLQNHTWRAADGPHYVQDSVVAIQTLTIESGAIICGGPGATIVIPEGSALQAVGTAANAIRFVAADPSRPWGGVRIRGGGVTIRHATFEYANNAIDAGGCVGVELEQVRIRQSGSGLVTTQPCPLVVRESVFDTLSGRAITSYLVGSAIESLQTSALQVVLEDNVIRNVTTGILLHGWNGQVTISGGRIEQAGRALVLEAGNTRHVPDGVEINSARPMRIVGSMRTVEATVDLFTKIWPVEHRDSLRGNASDTVTVEGAYSGHLVITRGIPVVHTLKNSFRIPWTNGISRVTVESGATFKYLDRASIGTLIVNGTAAAPARIYAAWFSVGCGGGIVPCTQSADTSFVRHAEFVLPGPAGFDRLVADSVTFDGGDHRGSLGISHSTITNAQIKRFLTVGVGLGVRLSGVTMSGMYAEGIWITGEDVSLQNCAITGNPGGGVRVFRGDNIRINDCNIERNGGPPVSNGSSARVDARRNWWGSPNGPPGSNAGEIQGDVDYSEYRTAAISSDPPAARVDITPGSATVATGDTVRFTPTARDASGNVLPDERFACRVASTIAECDLRLGLVAGLVPGATNVELIALSDTTKRATVPLQVVTGGVSFRWTRISQFAARWRFPFSVWGTSTSNVIVGGNELMVRFDGVNWSVVEAANGMVWHQLIADQTGTFYGIEGSNSAARRVLRFDGTTWQPMSTPAGNACHLSVGRDNSFAISTTFNFVAAPIDTIWMRNGESWQPLAPGIRTCDAWLRDADDVFAVQGPTVAHWNGTSWTQYAAATQSHLNSGHSIGPKPVWDSGQFAYGLGYNNARIVRFEHGVWQPMTGGCAARVILGTSDTNIFAAGDNGSLCHFDGTRWRNVWTGTHETIADLWFQGDEMFLVTVSGVIHHGRQP